VRRHAARNCLEIALNGMPLHIGWSDIALRLALTVIAGLLIGYNRTEHGKAAGLRTTLLTCLAASVAMIQMNLLLPTDGRSPGSFIMNDLMRLPLGILTGVGFIGGGAILRRDDIVVGVTTAATLWYVTVIVLCLGGGQIELGIAATVLGLAALWILDWAEQRLRRERRASLCVELEGGSLNEDRIVQMLASAGIEVRQTRSMVSGPGSHRTIVFELSEFRRPDEKRTPPICQALAREDGVVKLEWKI
jgi:putative Mg2+ transporter-C (MgtC) family protein